MQHSKEDTKMKTYKYIGLVATALMMGACSDGALVEDVVNTPNGGGETVDMTAEVVTELDMQPEENADGSVVPQTKTVMDAGQVTSWTNGDQISVSDGTLMYKYKVENANGASCTFTVVDGEKSIDHDGFKDNFNGCYPAAAVKGWNGTTVTAQVYAEQNYAENIDGGCFGAYMMTQGTVADNHISFKFKHAASVLEVNLATLGVTPKAVYLKANSGVNICGTIKCDAATGAITVTSPASSYCSSNDCDVIGLVNVASDATIARFYLLPVQIVGGVTVTVVDADGNYYTKSTSTTIGNTEGANTINKGTAVKPFYKKVNFGTAASATRKGNWMATVPSNTHFNLLSIPGAHNAATYQCGSTAKCQQYSITELLEKGVRELDIRPGVGSSSLTVYHGGVSCGITFADALTTINTWLDANPTEAVFLMVKPDKSSVIGGTESADDAWKNGVGDALVNVSDHIAMLGGTKTLNDVKGKMVVIAAEQTTAAAGNIGVGRVGWGSSYDDKTVMKGTDNNGNFGWTLVYQDEYETAANNRCAQLENFLTNYVEKNETNASRIYFSTANCSSNIEPSARTVNAALVNSEKFQKSEGRWGIISADFLGYSNDNGDKLLNMVINHNYKYLYKGRTRNVEAPTGGIGIDIAGDDKADEGEVFARKEK